MSNTAILFPLRTITYFSRLTALIHWLLFSVPWNTTKEVQYSNFPHFSAGSAELAGSLFQGAYGRKLRWQSMAQHAHTAGSLGTPDLTGLREEARINGGIPWKLGEHVQSPKSWGWDPNPQSWRWKAVDLPARHVTLSSERPFFFSIS